MELRSLKITKKGVNVGWVEQTKDKSDREVIHRGKQPAHSDLLDLLKGLRAPVLRMLGLSSEWGADLEIRKVAVSEQKGGRGLVISGTKPISGMTPLNVSTPLLHEPGEDAEEDESNPSPVAKVFELLDQIGSEADLYVDGKCAQLELSPAEEAANEAVGAGSH